jgi:hypothetical protein
MFPTPSATPSKPKEIWVASRNFPEGRAMVITAGNERFTCAHPNTWLQLRREAQQHNLSHRRQITSFQQNAPIFLEDDPTVPVEERQRITDIVKSGLEQALAQATTAGEA